MGIGERHDLRSGLGERLEIGPRETNFGGGELEAEAEGSMREPAQTGSPDDECCFEAAVVLEDEEGKGALESYEKGGTKIFVGSRVGCWFA